MAKHTQSLFTPRRNRTYWFVFGLIVLFAIWLGLVTAYQAGRDSVYVAPPLASQAIIAAETAKISAQFMPKDTSECVNATDSANPMNAQAYFYSNIHVNAYANRATIRACKTSGELLAKVNGRWVKTEVNLNLSARSNPAWSTVCQASDLLVPDPVVRPENASIDAGNLKMCQALLQNKILTIKDL